MSEPQETLVEFVGELRRLRLHSGAPTYDSLARSAGLSRSIVAEAFGGSKVPSERTVFGIVKALGEDPTPWLERRRELNGKQAAVAAVPDPTATAPAPESSAGGVEQPQPGAEPTTLSGETSQREESDAVEQGAQESAPQGEAGELVLGGSAAEAEGSAAPGQVSRGGRRVSVALLVPMLVIAAVLGAGLARAFWPREVPANEAGGAEVVVEDGDDIWQTGCIYDVREAATEERAFDTELGIRVSFRCMTAWGVLYRNDGGGHDSEIRLVIYPKRDVDPGTPQEVVMTDTQYAVTPMIVQNSIADDQFCVEGWITENGVETSLGKPVCA